MGLARAERQRGRRIQRPMEGLAVTPALLLALLIAIAYSADRTALSSQVAHLSSRAAHLEAERDSLHSRVELMEQASKAPPAQPSAEAALPERRGLQTVPNDRRRRTTWCCARPTSATARRSR